MASHNDKRIQLTSDFPRCSSPVQLRSGRLICRRGIRMRAESTGKFDPIVATFRDGSLVTHFRRVDQSVDFCRVPSLTIANIKQPASMRGISRDGSSMSMGCDLHAVVSPYQQ